jgi:hypothetical protein
MNKQSEDSVKARRQKGSSSLPVIMLLAALSILALGPFFQTTVDLVEPVAAAVRIVIRTLLN